MRLKAFLKPFLVVSAVAISITTVRPGSAFAREVVVPEFGGIVFADGRPVEGVIAVRLEAENSALIDTAFTSGSGKFLFRNIVVMSEEHYFLVIREPGYREVKHLVEKGYFIPDSAAAQLAHSSGSVILDLESLPPERKPRKTGPKAVDARQLKAEISDEARREFNLALKCIADGNSKEALAHLKEAVELSPEYYDALSRLGSEYMKAGRPTEARTTLERAQALNPNDPIPVTNLGILQFQEGEKLESAGDWTAAAISYRNAVDLFEKAQHLSPLTARTNLYLGIAYYRLGTYDKSEALLLNTLALNGRMYEARLTLVNLYNRQHRYEEALKQIEEYLQANPAAPERRQLEELRTRLQETLSRR